MALAVVWAHAAHAQDPDAASALSKTLRDRRPNVEAVMILKRECRAFAYFRADVDPGTRFPLHSMTKSVLSGLVGIAEERGQLGLDRPLGELLPEVLDPKIDARVRSLTIRQIVGMTAGLDAEAKPPPGLSGAASWRWSLTRPFLSEPGRQFRYDNYGANLVSMLLTRKTGQTAEAFARENLFAPLGIRDLTWTDDGDGHSMGAYGLWLTVPDMARFGLLYLQRGRVAGRQIVPEAFVAASTRPHTAGGPPFYAAYGYYWWVRKTRTGQDAFAAIGSDGQIIEVIPKQGLVLVVVSEKTEPGGTLAFVDATIMPAATALRSC